MVTPSKALRILCQVVFLLIVTSVSAQKDGTYRVVINMGRGTAPLMGFLYAVNDTAVVVLPSPRLRPKDVQPALQNLVPISIPFRIIKGIRISRARSVAYEVGVGMLISLGYAIGYIAIFPPQPTLGSFILYSAVVGTATIFTIALVRSKKIKLHEPGFVMRIQKYCIKRNGLAVDG
jgi:hypothetical protein